MSGSWIMGGQQLIENGAFAGSPPNSWDSTTSFYQTADAYSGAWAIRMGASGLGNKSVSQRGFDVVAGREYFLRFACKHGNVAMSSLQATLKNYALSSAWSDSEVFTPVGSYQVFGFGFTAGETGSASIVFEHAGRFLAPGSYTSVYLDAVTIYEAAEIGGDCSYKFTKSVPREDYVTRTGALHSYILSGSHRRFEVPAYQVSSAARCATNSFWHVGSPCFFVERAAAPESFYSVKITGNEEPFQTLAHPYGRTYFMGTLTLETSSAD